MNQDRKIIAFCCNWCGYTAADMAGVSRLQYPGDVRIIRVMCSGMIHPEFVIEALTNGADGVMMVGCPMGECHYKDGNVKAADRYDMITELMDDLGFEKERLSLCWLSSVEANTFANAVGDMSKAIEAV